MLRLCGISIYNKLPIKNLFVFEYLLSLLGYNCTYSSLFYAQMLFLNGYLSIWSLLRLLHDRLLPTPVNLVMRVAHLVLNKVTEMNCLDLFYDRLILLYFLLLCNGEKARDHSHYFFIAKIQFVASFNTL